MGGGHIAGAAHESARAKKIKRGARAALLGYAAIAVTDRNTLAGVVRAHAAAKEAGNVYTFGQAADMAEFGPMPRIYSIIDVWAPYYIARVQAGIDGSWVSTDTWDGIAPGMVAFAPFNENLPAEVVAEAQAAIDAIAAGTLHPFTGPINRQDGSAWLAAGEVADDGTLATMDFYVEGVTGDIPQ